MIISNINKFTVIFIFICLPGIVQSAEYAENIQNWQFECQRSELAPVHEIDGDRLFQGEPTLLLSGDGKDYVNGHFSTMEEVIPGKHYQFRIYFKSDAVEEPGRCILARILWMDKGGDQVGRAEYPATQREVSPEGWNILQQTYQIPEGSARAKIELVYRWDADGSVRFGGYSFDETDPIPPRLLNLATIHYRPERSAGPEENLKKYASYVRNAAKKGADIVCLPEGVTIVSTDLDYVSASEPVPGPSTDYLGKLAKELDVYIIAGIYEKKDGVVYNTAVLLDRNGKLAGKYRKLSLPREEIQGGITPGKEIPVFDTDFGRIGMMICWDVTFPETARALAKKGAEVIFLPIWGGDLVLTKARAIENQVYVVSSSYDMKSAIFDLEGNILAEATERDPVVVVEVDLNERKLWPWLGDFKNRIPREMPSMRVHDLFSPFQEKE